MLSAEIVQKGHYRSFTVQKGHRTNRVKPEICLKSIKILRLYYCRKKYQRACVGKSDSPTVI